MTKPSKVLLVIESPEQRRVMTRALEKDRKLCVLWQDENKRQTMLTPKARRLLETDIRQIDEWLTRLGE